MSSFLTRVEKVNLAEKLNKLYKETTKVSYASQGI